MNRLIQGKNGWVRAQRVRAGAHVTLSVEGRDTDGPSVAGVALDRTATVKLRDRLQSILARWPA